VGHAFDNFIKRYERAETAPVVKVKRARGKIDISQLFPFRHSKEEVEERMERFKNLQKRVTRQRLLIKQKDKIIQRNRALRLELERKRRFETRAQKQGAQVRIRNLHSHKPGTVPAKPSIRTSSQLARYDKTRTESPVQPGGIFSLTSANENSRLNQSTVAYRNRSLSRSSNKARQSPNTSLPMISSTKPEIPSSSRPPQVQVLRKLTNIAVSNYKLKPDLYKSFTKPAQESSKERSVLRKSTRTPVAKRL
jgi:hypothetical protein